MSNEGINTYSKPKKGALKKTLNSLQKVLLTTVTLTSIKIAIKWIIINFIIFIINGRVLAIIITVVLMIFYQIKIF